MTDVDPEHRDWPQLPWMLAAIGLVAGMLIDLVGGGDGPGTRVGWQAATSALFFFGPVAFGFTIERKRWIEPLAFSALVGLVMAGLAWRAVGAGDSIADPEYGFLAGLIATALALPLFQADFHRTRWSTPYERVHRNVWNDAICAGGSVVFLGASWLMLVLLSELFHLLKIDFLRDLMKHGWFGWAFSGAAIGAALGTLRNQIGVIGTLKTVVMVVLSILAVPLAAGLALFLVAMIVSGPDVLWEATRSATPILLSCAAGAWVLANAIVRDADAAMSGNRALRVAAMVLALSILPLTVFAAISMGTRVAQHGLSPERLWGLVAIAVATAYGLAWFVAIMRGWRSEWRENLRRANLHLAVLISVVALLLALPILDMGVISARQQVARLESGAVEAEDFDYAALRWDFGDAGRGALGLLAQGGGKAAGYARTALAQKERPWGARRTPRETSQAKFRVQPANREVERLAREYFRSEPYMCQRFCVVLDLGTTADGRRDVAIVHDRVFERVQLPRNDQPVAIDASDDIPALTEDSTVEIRDRSRPYVYIDGKPLRDPLD